MSLPEIDLKEAFLQNPERYRAVFDVCDDEPLTELSRRVGLGEIPNPAWRSALFGSCITMTSSILHSRPW